MSIIKRPKIGIALSGASGRAIAHIAILEVLKQHAIPIDVIVGCSSGALIAASYAIGTLEELKQWFHDLTKRKLFQLWSVHNSHGGIFHLNTERADKAISEITHDLNFEDIHDVKLAFVAADLDSGELVTLDRGSLNQAFKASVAVPGLFEPVLWGNRVLVDGGLVNIVPTGPTKQLGTDIVIGINLAATKFIYEKKMPLWRGYRFVRRIIGWELLREKILAKILPAGDPVMPGIMTVMSKAIEHSFRVEREWDDRYLNCDLMIEPGVKHFGKTEFKNLDEIYEEGRRAAEAAIPQIKQLIHDYSGR